jgi:two-component system, chemotaxis family, sensor kinase CheA
MAVDADLAAFLEDLFENLGTIEGAITGLDEGGSAPEILHDIFRAAHTIKGNASMMNLSNLVALGHALETALQEALAGNLDINRDAVRLFAECRLEMLQIGQALEAGNDASGYPIRETTDKIQILLLGNAGAVSESLSQAADSIQAYEISLRISKQEQAPSVRAFLVENRLAELGTIVARKPSEEVLESPEFAASDRELSFTLESKVILQEIQEHLNVDLIDGVAVRLLAEPAGVDTTTIRPIAETAKSDITSAAMQSTGDTIRLSVKTLDLLLNLTGELVIANSGLVEISEALARSDAAHTQALALTDKNREIFRIASEIQNMVMKSRMLPIEQVFSRFKRFVRDYAETSGKSIRLEISGEETELDKRVIDEIIKPLTHLIRNALDHGIELPADRLAQGKSADGLLKISAAQSGSSILITVQDDGRGMDLDKLLARAIEKRLVDPDAGREFTPEQIREFIFLPGFSTKESADEISGRGFGMDIVRDSIKKLSGDLTVTSTLGQGTRMVVKLPLTLAIVTTLTFRIRNDIFAIPLSVIEESLRIPLGSVVHLGQQEVVHTRDQILPFVRLDQVLGYPEIERHSDGEYAIVVSLHGNRIALGIDEFLKKQELVVKSLAENYRQVPGIAGASMLGNSEIVFIIDVEETIKMAFRNYVPTVARNSIASEVSSQDSVVEPAEPVSPQENALDVAQVAMKPIFEMTNKDLVRQWIAQSNKTAIQGIQMLTGNAEISVKKSRGSRVKSDKSTALLERILARAADIYLIHLPMMPATGAIDLILNKKGAVRMAQLLFDAAGIKNEGEFDPSPLLEITNILGSAFTNSLTFLTQTSVEPATPTLMSTQEEIEALIRERMNAPQSEFLVIENQYQIQNEDIQVELMIYLTG